MVDIHNYDNKIKNLVIIKKDFIAKKKKLNDDIVEYKQKKQLLIEELQTINSEWKKKVEEKNLLTSEINKLNSILKKKRKNGKRGKCMSGLTVNIKHRIPENIQVFFNFVKKEKVTRVDFMKSIQNYISENNLSIPDDKRYISLENKSDKLHNLLSTMKIEINTESKLRIQKFRTYIEKILYSIIQ